MCFPGWDTEGNKEAVLTGYSVSVTEMSKFYMSAGQHCACGLAVLCTYNLKRGRLTINVLPTITTKGDIFT